MAAGSQSFRLNQLAERMSTFRESGGIFKTDLMAFWTQKVSLLFPGLGK